MAVWKVEGEDKGLCQCWLRFNPDRMIENATCAGTWEEVRGVENTIVRDSNNSHICSIQIKSVWVWLICLDVDVDAVQGGGHCATNLFVRICDLVHAVLF